MRRPFLALAVLVLASCSIDSSYAVVGCDVRDSEAYNINRRIDLLHARLIESGRADGQFTHQPKMERPFVLVVLPPDGVTKEDVGALDLPREAKQWLELQIDDRGFRGPLLGWLEPTRAEWHPLVDGVSAEELLHVWKQSGEEVTIELTRIGASSVVTSLR